MPSTNDSYLSPTVPNLRAACDRCRDQKLKCSRSGQSPSGSCIRCSSLGLRCTASPRKRPGRRPAQPNQKVRQKSAGSNQDPCPGRFITPESQSRAYDADGDADANVDVDNDADADADADDDFSGLPAEIGQDFPGLCPSLALGNEFSDPSPQVSMDDFLSGYPINLDLDSIPGLVPSRHESNRQLRTDFTQPGNMTYDSDPCCQLSQLQHRLSRHLYHVKSIECDLTTYLHFGPSWPEETSQNEMLGRPPRFNPLTPTCKMMAEYKEILERLQGPQAGNVHQHELDVDAAAGVIALSCYLQFASIYDHIASQINRQVSQSPAVKGYMLLAAPGLSLAGVVVPEQKNILGRTLVQLMEAQIEPVEQLLGLPKVLCISTSTSGEVGKGTTGFLQRHQCAFLFKALGTRMADDAGHDGEYSIIESVKASLLRIKTLQ